MKADDMKDDENQDRPENVAEAASALTAALAAASPHSPPPELRGRVLARATRRRPLATIWRYAAVAALAALCAGLIGWNLAANQRAAAARRDSPDLVRLEATNEVVFDVISCKDGHLAVLKATQPGSMSYGKLYSCTASDDVVFMSGKLAPPPAGREYELWLTEGGQTRLQGRLNVWPSLAGSGYYFGSITFKGGRKDPSYQFAQLTLQAAGSLTPENPVVSWTG